MHPERLQRPRQAPTSLQTISPGPFRPLPPLFSSSPRFRYASRQALLRRCRQRIDPPPQTSKQTDAERHPLFETAVQPDGNAFTIGHGGLFGYALPFSPPQIAERSMSLKIVAEHWTDNARKLVLTVSGRPSRDYRLELVNGDLLASVDGATREGPAGLIVHIPASAKDEYADHQIAFALR